MKVLMSAYACDPSEGSEPGIGWNWATQAAKFHEVWVLTRANNRDSINAELKRRPVPNLHFIYHDLPRWARFWKQGARRLHLYYLLWQLTAVPLCRRLHAQIGFDVVHHITLGSHRFPSCLAWLPCPLIWGPVGGAERAPFAFYPSFGTRGMIQELLRDVSNLLTRLDPLVRHTVRKASKILVTTEDTRKVLPQWAQTKSLIVPAQGIQKEPEPVTRTRRRPDHGLSVLFVGRLIHWKGAQLAIRAFAEFSGRAPAARMTMRRDGPERGRLERLAARLGVGSGIRFEGEGAYQEAMDLYESHDVLLFPSLHDSGGCAVVEAMSRGLPIVCLDLGGPALAVTDGVGIKIRARSPTQVVHELAVALERLRADPQLRARMAEAGLLRVAEVYDWDHKGELLLELYDSLSSTPRSDFQ